MTRARSSADLRAAGQKAAATRKRIAASRGAMGDPADYGPRGKAVGADPVDGVFSIRDILDRLRGAGFGGAQ